MALRQIKSSGNWSNSLIWEGGILPLAADDVIAYSPNSTNIIALNTNISVRSISNYDTFQWKNTTIAVTSKFDNNGKLDINPGTKYLTGVINNYGVINQSDWSGGYYYYIYLQNASQIINKSDATYNLAAGGITFNVPSDYQGAEARFVNQGTLNKINAGYWGYIYVDLENTGLINIEGGRLNLYDELINNGTVIVNADGIYNSGKTTNNNVINLNAGVASFTGGGENKGIIYVDIDAALVTSASEASSRPAGTATGAGDFSLQPFDARSSGT